MADSILEDIASAAVVTSQLTAEWMARVDADVRDTKGRIHELVARERPAFDRQLSLALSIKSRFSSLTADIDRLTAALDDTENGLFVKLSTGLAQNREAQQRSIEASKTANALSHLETCSTSFHSIVRDADSGRLSDAVVASRALWGALSAAPDPLSQALSFKDMQRRLRALDNKVQEQLISALAHGVVLSSSGSQASLTVCSTVHSATLSHRLVLRDILRAVSADTLATRLNLLLRELVQHFVQPILRKSVRLRLGDAPDGKFMFVLPDSQCSPSALQDVLAVLEFVHDSLILLLPPPHSTDFASSLYAPVASAVLECLIQPSVPQTLASLPPFAELVSHAVTFEREIRDRFNITSTRGLVIAAWADSLPGYYEKQRREHLVEKSRRIVLGEQAGDVRVQVPLNAAAHSGEGVLNGKEMHVPQPEGTSSPSKSIPTWDFDDAEETNGDEASWGFDDSEPQADTGELPPEAKPSNPLPEPQDPAIEQDDDAADDAADDWGWEDNSDDADKDLAGSPSLYPAANDASWASSAQEMSAPSTPNLSVPSPTSSTNTPRSATRLEKFSAKARGLPITATPPPATTLSFGASPTASTQSPHLPSTRKQPPSGSPQLRPREPDTFTVSRCVMEIAQIVHQSMHEGEELMQSPIFDARSQTRRGALLLQSTSSVVDLFRAVSPESQSPPFGGSSTLALRFSNDCLYLASAARGSASTIAAKYGTDDKAARLLDDSAQRLVACSENWLEDTLDRRKDALADLLSTAEGFTNCADEERFLQCQTVVQQILKDIDKLAKQWEPVLARGAYFTALGALVESALAQMLAQVLALHDIPEVDSRNLSELFQSLLPLEQIFVDEHEGSLVVLHVRSWLKFSYLSELLSASLTDILYLFDEGDLVDFETDELVQLVRALFAETPQRATAIARLSGNGGR